MPSSIFEKSPQFSDGDILSAGSWNTLVFGGNGVDGTLSQGAGATTITAGSVYEYTSINIQSNGSLITGNLGSPVIIKCQGNCTIAGLIDLRGKGLQSGTGLNDSLFATAGAGGAHGAVRTGGAGGSLYPNGIGIMDNTSNAVLLAIGTGGAAGGSATGTNSGGGGGGAGASFSANGTDGTDGVSGAGGAGTGGGAGSAAAGGGALYLEVGGNLTLSGSVMCNGNSGGVGGDGVSNNAGGGGGGAGGGGGTVWFRVNGTITNTGEVDITGGTGGAGGNAAGTGGDGGTGGTGGTGTSRVEKI